jgi:predicted flap endonuclease-1-like 5' DNA nuclease
MPVDTRPNTTSPLITTSKKPIEMEPDIETINGIGPKYSGSLRNVGIKTVNDLLRAGATKYGRQNLANKVGVTYATLLKWVHRGDLLRINGVGKKYSALLESAGVGTIKDLSLRNPIYLYQELKIVNNEQKLVKRTPPSKTIEIWVKSAKNLKPIIE